MFTEHYIIPLYSGILKEFTMQIHQETEVIRGLGKEMGYKQFADHLKVLCYPLYLLSLFTSEISMEKYNYIHDITVAV